MGGGGSIQSPGKTRIVQLEKNKVYQSVAAEKRRCKFGGKRFPSRQIGTLLPVARGTTRSARKCFEIWRAVRGSSEPAKVCPWDIPRDGFKSDAPWAQNDDVVTLAHAHTHITYSYSYFIA